MPDAGAVQFKVEGRVARVTLDNPPLHILNGAMLASLDAAIGRVERETSAAVCVLSSTGEKAFSAGVDIQDQTPERARATLDRFHDVVRKLRRLECVTIAAVRGMALGGGFELALACDMMVAEEESNFGVPEIWLACFPPIAAAVLPRHIAPQKAYELVLSGEPIDAAEARQLGLVNAVAPRGGLEVTLGRFVSLFTEKSAAALRIAKRALRVGEELPFGPALAEIERLYLEELMKTRDAREGIGAHLAKREPKWEDR